MSRPHRAFILAVTCLLLLGPLACKGSGDDDATQDPDRVGLETHLGNQYYSVRGATAGQIFEHIERFGPTDDLGQRGSGLTAAHWSYNWRGETTRNRCRIESMTISLDLTITLPAHEEIETLAEPIRQDWQRFADGVARHEQHHVDIYLDGARELQLLMAEIPPLPDCDGLEAEIKRIWEAEQAMIDGDQDAFHGQEDARLALQRRPLELQLQSSRDRLAFLSNEIQAQDAVVASRQAQVSQTESQLNTLLRQISAIEAQYPNGAPPNVFAQYQALRSQYNGLVEVYNARVQEYNAAVQRLKDLSSEYEPLLAATNALVDQLNWAR